MKIRLLKSLAAAAAVAAIWPTSGMAADVPAPADSSGWTFTAALYGWGAGLNGDVGVLDQPPEEVDLTFADLLENLDFAAMGLMEARNGPFVLGMDLTYVKLGASVDLPDGSPTNEIDISTTEWMVTGFGGYSVLDTEDARLDLIAGARLWSVDSSFDYNGGQLDGLSDSDGETWVDPLVGAKVLFDVTPDFYVSAWGMVGGFSAGSDMMWDVMAGAGYAFTDTFSLFGGYRAVSVDYENDGFVFDVVQQGPVVAGVFKF